MEIPGGIFYPPHRVAMSGYYHDTLEAIEDRWSLARLVEAHLLCDAFDAARPVPKGGDL